MELSCLCGAHKGMMHRSGGENQVTAGLHNPYTILYHSTQDYVMDGMKGLG